MKSTLATSTQASTLQEQYSANEMFGIKIKFQQLMYLKVLYMQVTYKLHTS